MDSKDPLSFYFYQLASSSVVTAPVFVSSDSCLRVVHRQEALVDNYRVPKRALSLLSRWKTLEQFRNNLLTPNRRASKKQELPGTRSPTSRGLVRSLRPPGLPMRWG